jgi:hypothetical protein
MTDLVEFVAWLRQQIDEDERVARAAIEPKHGESGQWYDLPDDPWAPMVEDRGSKDVIVYDEGRPTDGQAAHIARHDPARVLAEVAAKRAIVDGCEETLAREDSWDPMTEGGSGEEFELARFVIRQQAQPYAGRPGWREEWAT